MGESRSSSVPYAAADTQAVYASKARVSNVMRDRKMRRLDYYAAATQAAAGGASDEEIERILREGDGAKHDE
jgi:hypothetical protein